MTSLLTRAAQLSQPQLAVAKTSLPHDGGGRHLDDRGVAMTAVLAPAPARTAAAVSITAPTMPVSRNVVSYPAAETGQIPMAAGGVAAGALEQPWLRTATSDTYSQNDGWLQKRVYDESINYATPDGSGPIDPDLTAVAGGGWQNSSGPYSVSLPPTLASPVVVNDAAGSLGMSLARRCEDGWFGRRSRDDLCVCVAWRELTSTAANYFVKEPSPSRRRRLPPP